MKEPGSPQLRSECAILAGMAQATLPGSVTPWQRYVEDYDRIRDTMARVLDGFEDFNRRARYPHGFRLSQPARERGFATPSGRAEFSLAPLPDDVDPGEGRLVLATIRSHDQFNTTIYSNDDRYRGLKGLRTVVFMNEDDMRDRGLDEFDLIDITSFSKDGSKRTAYGYRAVRFEIPTGCAAGYMPELNVLCGIADCSAESEQPVTKPRRRDHPEGRERTGAASWRRRELNARACGRAVARRWRFRRSTCWGDAISPALAAGFRACQGTVSLRESKFERVEAEGGWR